MKEENKASYEASSFIVNASKIEFDDKGAPTKEDFPAFVHEWWHYIQDTSTITGQNGFYLWLRDIVQMSTVTCVGEGNSISIPMPKDVYNQVYSKNRRLYNIFCGKKSEEYFNDATITQKPSILPNKIKFDGEERTFAKCIVYINNTELIFGLIALQELNAYYCQKIVESFLPDTKFNVPADTLAEYPYKLGDLLFDFYKIECDLYAKFFISTIALDTLQAPAVFLSLLERLSGNKIEYTKDKQTILQLFEEESRKHSHSSTEALDEWFKDYSNWLRDEGHIMLRESLSWYITSVGAMEKLKADYGLDAFVKPLTMGINQLSTLYSLFPAPLIKKNGEVLGQTIRNNAALSAAVQHDFENALIIWSHRRIYDLLKSEKIEDVIENSTCPLYNEGKCIYLCKYPGKKYDCKTAPWMVVKGEKQALCPYAVAAHSMGLWQNEININF